jgi:hypothetical protein
MRLVDALAVALLIAAATAFVLGQSALSRSDDLTALYWLAVGVASLVAATRIARPGARA